MPSVLPTFSSAGIWSTGGPEGKEDAARRIVRAAVLDGHISEHRASAFRVRLLTLPHIPEAGAAEFSRLSKIGETAEAEFRQVRAAAMERKHDRT